ncbi:Hypothetical predicted protein [Mytilus galloprovincialis]|uniref:CARD domain-containing protein n=1 Tax=Mytilus galloprovincialis TaxID=29158 RepID=A0A8B6FKE1_MYTGA|nr:Hypothetical predicted protein [Mytilus galloprovincialis]
MDRRDQKKLIRNLGRLVAETPTDPVVQYLVDKNILTSELAEDILYQNTSRNKIGQLVFTLARREDPKPLEDSSKLSDSTTVRN